jgi:hypothetical protein
MKKRLYFIISLLTVIILLSVSAVCTQCGAATQATGTEDTEESKKTDVEDVDEETTEEEEETTQDEDEETTEQDEETTESTEEDDKEAPTIKLEIYEGPTYSAADDVCFYRIKAVVTGNPNPAVTFSKDDSNGAWGALKCQINIERGEEYTLTAKAKNSEGERTATLKLEWGCGDENRDPEIDEIIVSEEDPVTGQTYILTGDADDPDGDSLTYKWTVSGGSLSSDTSNPTNWTTPAAVGDYQIKLKVEDGKGGDDEKTLTVGVLAAPVVSADMPIITSQSGYISSNGSIVLIPGPVYAGDSNTNLACQGFFCFDISSLAGKTVQNATMQFTIKTKWGDPGPVFSDLALTRVDWGSGAPNAADYGLSGDMIITVSDNGTGTFITFAPNIKTFLQENINDGKSRFKLRIHFIGAATDNDNNWDGWEYDPSGIKLTVSYN